MNFICSLILLFAVLDCLQPYCPPFEVATEGMTDEKGEPLEVANKPTMIIRIPYEKPVTVGSFLRMKAE